eukprot:scaffold394495_cov37-Prasinocladus_malaysianus.AAC.1
MKFQSWHNETAIASMLRKTTTMQARKVLAVQATSLIDATKAIKHSSHPQQLTRPYDFQTS